MTDANIQDLCPDLLTLYREWLMRCNAAGLAVKVAVTWRSPSEQNAAKAAGLSNAAANESPHNCLNPDGEPASKAFDFACFGENGEYITDGADDRYMQAGEIAEDLGLEWAGRWPKPDFDHIQIKDWKLT